jgi:hypothetical protein
MLRPRRTRPMTCPGWCVLRHGAHAGEEDHLHVGGALLVRHELLRLVATIDPATGAKEGPFVLMGSRELTLHEAEALIGALTQLVDEGLASAATQDLEGALTVLDPQFAQHRGDVDTHGGG